MATNTKAKEVKKEEVKEEKVYPKSLFALWKWINKGKEGKKFVNVTGFAERESDTPLKLVAEFRTNKNNPKEPDMVVYLQNADYSKGEEYATIWCNVSKAENKYLSGYLKTPDKAKIIGFIDSKNVNTMYPTYRFYLQSELDNPTPSKEDEEEPFVQGGGLDNPDTPNGMYDLSDDDLPF